MVVGNSRVPARLVGTGSDGLPKGPGVVHGAGGWIVQLRAPVSVGPGTAVTLRLPDGRTLRWTVVSRSAPGPRTAAASSTAPLTLIVPADKGRWVVVTAR